MSTTKVAISLETKTLKEVDRLVHEGRFPSRSRAVQTALTEMIARRKGRSILRHLEGADAIGMIRVTATTSWERDGKTLNFA